MARETRFGALSADESRASSTYKVSGSPAGDLYILNRHIPNGRLKISLHASGLWKVEDNVTGKRDTWEPTDEVLSGDRPAVSVLVGGSGLLFDPPEIADMDSVHWATFQPDTVALRFEVYLMVPETHFVTGPRVTAAPLAVTAPLLGRVPVLMITWKSTMPASLAEGFSVSVADEYEDCWRRSVERMQSGESVASYWAVTDHTCLVIDHVTVMPRETDTGRPN